MTSDSRRPLLMVGAGCLMMGIALGATLASRVRPPSPEPALLAYRGLEYPLAQLPQAQRTALSRQGCDFDAQRTPLLREAGWALHVIDHARAHGLAPDEAEAQLLALAPVSDDDINALYTRLQTRIGRPLFEVRDALRDQLQRRREEHARDQQVDRLMARGDLILLAPPLCDPSPNDGMPP